MNTQSTPAAHTPTPWRFSRVEPEDFSGMKAWGDAYEVVSTDDNPVNELYVGFCLRPEDAALIVRAVNSHASLVAINEELASLAREALVMAQANGLDRKYDLIVAEWERVIARAEAMKKEAGIAH